MPDLYTSAPDSGSRAPQWALVVFIATILAGGASAQSDLVITGVIDGPLSGGTPKAIELYVVNPVADLSTYGVGSANNGGGTDGVELVLSGSAAAGTFLYVASEAPNFTAFFGFAPTFTGSAANINGDDAIELFYDATGTFTGSEVVVDVFGDIDTDGSGEAWEYTDGWAYRVDGSGPDGSAFDGASFVYSGPNALDGETSNATAETPFPAGTYAPATASPPAACTPAAPLLFSGYDADPTDGSADPRGEVAELANDAGDGTAVDLSGCDFVVFDPYTEEVTYAADAQGVLADGEKYAFATVVPPPDGQPIPSMTLPDGPGVFALIAGSASPGQDVGEVLAGGDVVAAVVYLDDDTVFGSVRGGAAASANASALAAALAQLRSVDAEADGRVALDVEVAPNPLGGTGRVAFGLAEAADVRVAVFDALGREVAVLADRPFGVGLHTVPVAATGLPPGAYLIQVAVGGRAGASARLTVAR